jgi:hypothetical protein
MIYKETVDRRQGVTIGRTYLGGRVALFQGCFVYKTGYAGYRLGVQSTVIRANMVRYVQD